MFRKIITCLIAVTMGLSITACSSASKKNTLSLDKGITLTLTDVWKISSSDANTVYYYYLATIKNKTKKNYSLKDISYKITNSKGDHVNSIDSSQETPFSMVYNGESAYLYGFIGYPNDDQTDIGLRFGKDKFIAFDSIDLRESNDEQIKKKGTGLFNVFTSDELDIKVNTKDATDTFKDGVTTLSHVYLTYKNKTDKALVIPYLVPHSLLNGIDLSQYSDKGNFSSMSLEELKKIDFKKNGMMPKTSDIEGQTSGYIVYYLRPKQEIKCDITSVFTNTAIDYSDTDKKVFTIRFESAPFGSTTEVTVARTS